MSEIRSASRGGGNSRMNRSHQDGEEIGSNPNHNEVDMELMDPNKKLIEPDHGNIFKPNPTVVVHTIVKCMNSKIDGAWISWKKVPKNVIDTWFGEFQGKSVGKEVSDIDLFMATHQKEDKTWVDSRSAKSYEKWSNAWKDLQIAEDTNESSSQNDKLTQDQLWASVNATTKG